MLQPDSYWGRENLAYHQALPLVFILGALWIAVCQDSRKRWHGPSIFLLGLLASMTYISGAFGTLAAGASLLMTARFVFRVQDRQDVARNGWWFAAAGGIGAAVQLYRAIIPSGGTHAGIPLVMPDDPQFWAFLFGKVGRSLLLPPNHPELAATIVLLVCAVAVWVALLLARKARASEVTLQQRRVAAIYIALGAVVFVYLMMVAAGRTRYRPPEMRHLLDIFAYAFTRFHFFWVTLVWPWSVAALVILARARNPGEKSVSRSIFVAAAMVVLAVLAYKGNAFDHMETHRAMAKGREDAGRCLMESLQREGAIRCSGLIPPRFEIPAPDSYGAYAYAWNTGASFVRNYPILSSAKRSDVIPPFYKMSHLLGLLKIEQMKYLGGGAVEVTGSDPKLFIDTLQPKVMLECSAMDVEVDLKMQMEDAAQIFFLSAGAEHFDETHSLRIPVAPSSQPRTIRFHLESDTGFQNPIRLDLATQPQTIEVSDIRAYCRKRR